MRAYVSSFLLSLILLLGTGCESLTSLDEAYRAAMEQGSQGTSLRFAVKHIHLDKSYQPNSKKLPSGYLYVEDRAPLSPLIALNRYLSRKLEARGDDYSLRVHIVEASIVKVPLPPSRQIPGWYASQVNPWRYDLRYDVDLEILDRRGYVIASANSVVIENSSPQQKVDWTESEESDLLHELILKALGKMDREIQQAARVYLSDFLL